MGNIGPLEIAIVLVIVLLIFGPKRLPGLGKQLGTGMREFKESITGENKGKDDDDEDDGIAGLPPAPVADPVAEPVAEPAEAETDRSPSSNS